MISADNVAYYALILYLKLIQTHPRPFNRLTFANGSAFVSVFISTARKLTIVSRATVIKDLFTICTKPAAPVHPQFSRLII